MATLKNKILFALLLCPLLLFSENIEADNYRDKVIAKYDTIQTFQANFTQNNSWKQFEKSIFSKGKIYYDKSNLILRYESPEKQILLLNDEFMKLFNPQTNQLIISDNDQINLEPIKIILQYWDISEISIRQKNDDAIIILRYEAGEIEAVINNYIIYKVIIKDLKENVVSYEFGNISVNSVLSQEIFDIEVDEDVNIIDMRK